jgi:hypothetical protein
MLRTIETLVHVARLHQALKDLKEVLDQTDRPTTLWFDFIPSGGGVLVQGFLDIELANGNAVSHDLDLSGNGSKCTVSAAQTLITPEGREVLVSTGNMECATFEQWVSAMAACEQLFRRISNSSPIFGL